MNTSVAPNPADDRLVPYYEEAFRLLVAGERPTADKLLVTLGGSKATAVAALQSFWSGFLRDRLAGAGHGKALPTPIHTAAQKMYEVMLQTVMRTASQETQSDRQHLATERAAIDGERLAFERLKINLQEKLQALQDANDGLARQSHQDQAEIGRLRTRNDELQAGLTAAHEQYTQAQEAATAARQARAAAEAERDRLQQKLDAEKARVADLFNERQNLQARLESSVNAGDQLRDQRDAARNELARTGDDRDQERARRKALETELATITEAHAQTQQTTHLQVAALAAVTAERDANAGELAILRARQPALDRLEATLSGLIAPKASRRSKRDNSPTS